MKVKPTKRSYFSGYIYYYIDDISLIPTSSSESPCKEEKQTVSKSDIPTAIKTDSIIPDSSIVLNNIFFETDKAVLLPPSFAELDKLVKYLATHKIYLIALSGYTDNEGSESHNQKLSEARAQSVSGYLILKGIEKTRVTFAGFGSNNPIAPNDKSEGRQKNRRVEFKLTLAK